jgi:hypothetical protein
LREGLRGSWKDDLNFPSPTYFGDAQTLPWRHEEVARFLADKRKTTPSDIDEFGNPLVKKVSSAK